MDFQSLDDTDKRLTLNYFRTQLENAKRQRDALLKDIKRCAEPGRFDQNMGFRAADVCYLNGKIEVLEEIVNLLEKS